MTKKDEVKWNSFTKAELIRTIKALNRRQTALLNRIAELERVPDDAPGLGANQRMPWETVLDRTKAYT